MVTGLEIGDERGTTMIEVLVATATGMVVLLGLTMVIVTTMHGTARVSARVHATQSARIAVTRVIDELHSACVAPKIAPIQPESTGTSLRFLRATGSQGSAVAPVPVYTVISLSGDELSQTDYQVSGSSPTWTPTSTVVSGPRQLMSGVSPVAPSSSIFTYHAYTETGLSATPLATPLSVGSAAAAVEVRLALTASADATAVPDKGAPAVIQNSAVLRLTPPSFNEKAIALPCR